MVVGETLRLLFSSCLQDVTLLFASGYTSCSFAPLFLAVGANFFRVRDEREGEGRRCFMARNMTNTHENSEFQDVWKEEGKCLSNSRQFALLHFSFRSPRIRL